MNTATLHGIIKMDINARLNVERHDAGADPGQDGILMEHTFGINEIEFCRSSAFLLRDGVEQYCPFFGKNNCGDCSTRCGNWCPHFKLRKNGGGGLVLTLTCGHGAPTMTIEQAVEP